VEQIPCLMRDPCLMREPQGNTVKRHRKRKRKTVAPLKGNTVKPLMSVSVAPVKPSMRFQFATDVCGGIIVSEPPLPEKQSIPKVDTDIKPESSCNQKKHEDNKTEGEQLTNESVSLENRDQLLVESNYETDHVGGSDVQLEGFKSGCSESVTDNEPAEVVFDKEPVMSSENDAELSTGGVMSLEKVSTTEVSSCNLDALCKSPSTIIVDSDDSTLPAEAEPVGDDVQDEKEQHDDNVLSSEATCIGTQEHTEELPVISAEWEGPDYGVHLESAGLDDTKKAEPQINVRAKRSHQADNKQSEKLKASSEQRSRERARTGSSRSQMSHDRQRMKRVLPSPKSVRQSGGKTSKDEAGGEPRSYYGSSHSAKQHRDHSKTPVDKSDSWLVLSELEFISSDEEEFSERYHCQFCRETFYALYHILEHLRSATCFMEQVYGIFVAFILLKRVAFSLICK